MGAKLATSASGVNSALAASARSSRIRFALCCTSVV
jgi:hypothetical protein